MMTMRVTACLLLALFVSSAYLGVCNGAVWFEGYNPKDNQEIMLDMQHIENPVLSWGTCGVPRCFLRMSETEPHLVNLTIIVSTAALIYQTENFETWLSIDSQESETLVGVLDVQPSAAGEIYQRQYNLALNGLGDGSHLIKIRVAGDYEQHFSHAHNYDCEGNATFIIDNNVIIDNQTEPPSTTTIPSPTQKNSTFQLDQTSLSAIIITVAAAVAVVVGVGLAVYHRKRRA